MQALVRLLHLLLPKASPRPALVAWLARHSYAPRGISAILLLSVIDIPARRISDEPSPAPEAGEDPIHLLLVTFDTGLLSHRA